MAFVGALIGHSFASSLADHFSRGGSHPATPANVACRLSISHRVGRFYIYGSRGARVMPSASYRLPAQLASIRASYVIVDIGGNDLAKGCSPLDVAYRVLTLAHSILNDNRAQHVTLCSALHRTKNTGNKSAHQYNILVNQYNNILRNFCDAEDHVTYHTHRGFWQCDHASWSRDGTHPNTPLGRKNYIRSLRNASNFTLKFLRRDIS